MIQYASVTTLIEHAIEAKKFSYAPYSGFNVGAALMGSDGKIYKGCNIECATFSPTNCAERTALFKAVSEGEHKFMAIAVVASRADGFDDGEYTYPCGVCRQMLYEFAGPDLIVIIAREDGKFIQTSLGELLPHGFAPDRLAENV